MRMYCGYDDNWHESEVADTEQTYVVVLVRGNLSF